VVTPPHTGVEGDEEQWKNDQREYWGRQIKAQWWLNGITIVAGLIALVGLCVIYRSLKETHIATNAATAQAKTAQAQLELSERPWITVSNPVITGSLTVDNNGVASTSVSVIIKNIGKSPARIFPQWELTSYNQADDVLSKMCHQSPPWQHQKEVPRLEALGPILFPDGDPPPINLGLPGKLMSIAPRTYLVIPSVVGCIIYKSFTTDEIYYTGFIYDLSAEVGKGAITVIRFETDGSIIETPTQEVDLRPFTKSGNLVIPKGKIRLIPSSTGVIIK
jgi:hypothetical protein